MFLRDIQMTRIVVLMLLFIKQYCEKRQTHCDLFFLFRDILATTTKKYEPQWLEFREGAGQIAKELL